MVFNENSFLVRFYVKQFNEGKVTREEIPILYNLYDEVNKLISGE